MPHDARSNVGVSNEDSHLGARWPPRGGVLDRLARWLEGGGDGITTDQLLDLSTVLAPPALDALHPEVARFYRDPGRYRMRAGVHASRFSGALLDLLALVSRQGRLPDRDRGEAGSDGFEGYPVRQELYRDARGRTHWDRYILIDRTWQRFFIARLGGLPSHVVETFVVYGIPVALTFRASVEDDDLVLSLVPKWSSPMSWFARVVYRTGISTYGVHTRGDFRLPIVGFRVRTEFRATRAEP